MSPRAARRRSSPHAGVRDIEQEVISPDEIDALTPDEDDHDEVQIRIEAVDAFRVAGSYAWVGPED